jgi:hypothetical protein
MDATARSFLRSSRDQVGWLTQNGGFLQFSLTGSETGRFPGPPVNQKRYERVTSLAVGDDLSVVAAVGPLIWALDRVKKEWNRAEFEGEPVNSVFGYEGDQLVMGGYSKDRGFLLVRFRAAME